MPGKVAKSLLFPQSFLYLAWYTTMSILGHYNNFFFAAHLLDIAMGFKTLRTILSSVTHNGKQVLDLYCCRTVWTYVYPRTGKEKKIASNSTKP